MFLGFKLTLEDALESHRHTMHEFAICLSGHGHYLIEGQGYECKPGNTLFIPSKITHSITTRAKTPLEIYCFCVKPEKLNQFIPGFASQSLMQLLSGISIAKYDSHTGKQTLSIIEKVLSQSDTVIESPSYLIVALFNELIAHHLSACETPQGYQWQANNTLLINSIEWLAENYAKEISVDTMAEQTKMSRSTFTRQFRKYTGMSLIDYCLKLRIQAATEALATSNIPITELAYDCGFSNLSHFHRVFRRHTAMSPGAYRNFLRFQGMK